MDMLTQAIATLANLVAIPSVPGQRNAEIVAHVSELLKKHGARVQIVPSPINGENGIVASIGPDVAGGVVLSGHLDVVSTEGQIWTGDPFTLRRGGERLFGRGTTDMKGFVACALTLMTAQAGARLDRPLHLFLSADEESTCRSVESLVQHATAHLPPVRGVIVGEPTQMQVANQHKGAVTFLVEVTGRPIHASMADQGISAITVAAQLVNWLDEMMQTNAAAADATGPYVPNFSTHTVGTISGGTSNNTVAESCRFQWDARLMPGDEADDLVAAFNARLASLTCCGRNVADEITVRLTREAFFPALLPVADSGFLAEILSARGANVPSTVPYGTEAGIIQQAGFEVIVCGPGNANCAHIADEFVEMAQLKQCLDLLGRMV